MRILQVIDSLEVGGAERMAVNYANALAVKADFSALAATRKEGSLKSQLGGNVPYIFLDKKGKIDFRAISRLKAFCKKHEVAFLHAHGTSFFMAFLLKLVYPKIKIVWHDHYGLSEFLEVRKSFALKIASLFFHGVISVNGRLKAWAEKELYCKKVIYLPNFTSYGAAIQEETTLNGQTGKRILCLANLRPQKNHMLLLQIAEKLKMSHPDWSFHLVGKDFGDHFSRTLYDSVRDKNLSDTVFFYGSRNDTVHIIGQSDICILTSKSEGLPVALLEYGLFKKPVVVTDVGEIPLIIKAKENGLIVPSDNGTAFYEALVTLVENETMRARLGNALHETVMRNNSEEAVIAAYLDWLKK